jgi:hypothetical protein
MPGSLLKHNGSIYGNSLVGVAGGSAAYNIALPSVITPSTDEKLLNGTFASWTGDNPTNWITSGEVGTNPEVSEVGAGEGHGGAGTGMCNIYTTGATVHIRQAVLVVHSFYRVTGVVDNTTGAGVTRYVGATDFAKAGITWSVAGSYQSEMRSQGTTFSIYRQGATDTTIDNVSALLLTNLYSAIHSHTDSLSYNQITMSIAANSAAGVWHRHVASGDEVLAYIDRIKSTLWLLKKVGGTTTEVASVAITYVDGKAIKLRHSAADTWEVYYDTPANLNGGFVAALITNNTLTDINLDLCDADGYFAANPVTSFVDYRYAPG